VTICIQDYKTDLFGQVVGGEMVHNEAGEAVRQYLYEIPLHFPHARVDAEIVMPNHVHVIIEIMHRPAHATPVGPEFSAAFTTSTGSTSTDPAAAGSTTTPVGSAVGIQNFESLRNASQYNTMSNTIRGPQCKPGPDTNAHACNNPGDVRDRDRWTAPTYLRNEYQHMIRGSIGSIVRGLKIGVTKWFRTRSPVLIVWQHNYDEHIIRDFATPQQIREYIARNPTKWSCDHEAHIAREIAAFGLTPSTGH
jgi:REP element-mobilizing transposase RayT